MSNLALLINLGALGVYGYSAYHMNSIKVHEGMKTIVPPQLNVYGQLKFLTYQCLLIQILSTILHILAHFIKPLRPLRDLIFTTLAYPVGSIVVYTFWAVWFALGRELILPAKMDQFYPPWLNHSTHTIIAPINIIMSLLINHKYIKFGLLITLVYSGLYTAFLHLIKAQTGLFVYGYLNEFNETQRMVYFALTGVFAYMMYKSGHLLTCTFHGAAEKKTSSSGGASSKQSSKKQKQK